LSFRLVGGDAGMAQLKATNNRFFSIAGFSLLFAYLLSFLFEGQVLYSMLAYNNVLGSPYILVAIIAHFAGESSLRRKMYFSKIFLIILIYGAGILEADI
jgi:hypothetical protein